MKKVLITGITGLVGSAFVSCLLKEKKDIQILASIRPSKKENGKERMIKTMTEQYKFDYGTEPPSEILDRIHVVEGEVTDPVHLAMSKKLDGVDSVFHCAADVNLGPDTDGSVFEVNFRGTESMLKIARELKVSFHYVSTAYVAGKTAGKIMEDSLPAKKWHNAYEKSKFHAEHLVRDSGIPFTIYRPSIVVGRLSDGLIRKPLAFYYILEFLAVLKERHCAKHHLETSDWLDMPMRLKATPSKRVYFVPIDYVQKAICRLFQRPAIGRTYHLTGTSPVSTKGIENAVKETLKVKNVRIVDDIPDPTMDEKLLHRFLGEFLPYFGSQAEFDVSNAREDFGSEHLSWNIHGDKLSELIGAYFKEYFPECCRKISQT